MARHNAKHMRKKLAQQQKLTRSGYMDRICTVLEKARNRPVGEKDLKKRCHAQASPYIYQAALDLLVREHRIELVRQGYVLCSKGDEFQAEVVRLAAGFGFIRDAEGTDHFVPGKFLAGAMPGDKVLARPIPPRQEGAPEAQVLSVLSTAQEVRLCGCIEATEEGLCLRPDGMRLLLRIDYRESVPYGIGDQVLCVLTTRGERHAEHKVKVLMNFGSAECAAHVMEAKLAAADIPQDFPEEVLREAQKLAEAGISDFDREERLDLREACILTIDGAHSKDLDDAVSVERRPEGGYRLGVHIADVSRYVRPGTPLDAEAFRRGTSIYYGDRVIPMLPPALSNGICSLNGGEERLAVSAIMELSEAGDLLSAKFHKSLIRSAVRGVYSECNAILGGTASAELLEKYAPVEGTLRLLDELTDKLEHLRELRGAPELESVEAVPILDENGICIGLAAAERGRSERIVEACMLTANEAAARTAREAEIPLVYRVHEDPSPERIEMLLRMLERLGGEAPHLREARPQDIQALLNGCRGEEWYPVINSLTLRAMAKAKYSEEPLGHFGLALADYAHFTSPIRRYADLAVHRILSDLLTGAGKEWMAKRHTDFAERAALQASETEVRAIQIEREADDCYAAEYMRSHIGEVFRGVISGVTEHGLYVTLENMAEGLLHIQELPDGEYEVEEGWRIKECRSGVGYCLGDALEVVCAKAEVCSGRIDFVLAVED